MEGGGGAAHPSRTRTRGFAWRVERDERLASVGAGEKGRKGERERGRERERERGRGDEMRCGG